MSRDWTKAFFRAPVFTPGSAEAEDAAAAETRFLWKALRLKKGSRVLDIPCGTGRHALRLARRGASVLGVDITEAYLKEARRKGARVPNARFVRGDMRRIPLEGEFDAAINLWTSFGYFADPADDLRVLRGVARALKPGGLFLIDLNDFAAIRQRGRVRNWAKRADGSYLLEEAVFVGGWDPKSLNEWTILRPGRKPVRARFFVRGYDRARLFALLRKAGLTPLRTWTALAYGPSSRDGLRLVVLSRKAEKGAGGAAVR